MKSTQNKRCIDETLPNMAMVAWSRGSWVLVMGPVVKKHNNKVGPWRLAWWWKKVPKSSLRKALKPPHLHRRRNQFFKRNDRCDKKNTKPPWNRGGATYIHNCTWNCSSKAGSRRQNQEKNDVNKLCKRKGGGKSSPHAGAKICQNGESLTARASLQL